MMVRACLDGSYVAPRCAEMKVYDPNPTEENERALL